MIRNQFYGIKYPFTNDDSENYFVDLNSSLKDKVRSMIMHLVFTPKGQKIRDLEFGTNLIKYIFEPNDELTWGEVQNEIRETVTKYIPNVTITNVEVLEENGDKRTVYVKLEYSVTNGINETKDSIVTTI